ncbi:MAG: metalloregulator ArsR/SmtB family transcription factor [Chitinivibrionales bacterium]|nr:metalloregulator ArsR/SmtB family transcription factor [Chitinivibrionales bacterium]
MKQQEKLKFEAQAQIMKALAHSTRLFIVHRLAEREHCVCELTDLIGADISTVSKHLSIMKNAGIIGSERRNTNIYYSLKMPCILNFFSCANEVLKKKLEEQMDIV